MVDRRTQNVKIFEDTVVFVEMNSDLSEAVKESQAKQKLYFADDSVDIPEINAAGERVCETVISQKRSFEAASQYARAGKKVCVLNFASATNPGGGVVHGSSAQEESLCRCSTLYWCLNTISFANDFYMPHRQAMNPLYNDDCIYTPGVVVCKSDISYPERMEQKDWYKVDVITCAAPNLRRQISDFLSYKESGESPLISNEDLFELHKKRIDKIFRVAIANGAQVLILGAFGCGAFVNPPEVVSKAFKEVQSKYESYFEIIEYAIFCGGSETENYKSFAKTFCKRAEYDLSRFISAHEEDYELALKEIRAGRKRSHWIWYIFPQIKGLGRSRMANFYAVSDVGEAKAYMDNEILGAHMIELCESLLALDMDDPLDIFDEPDDNKLRSSMTLFEIANPEIDLFGKVLDKYFGSIRDYKTIEMLSNNGK